MMLFIVPVTLFSVTYETGRGRPYSSFESLVLRAIAGGITDLAGLEAEFKVHPRVLIEALVTLIHAGWVALGSAEADVAVTEAGRAAAGSDAAPTTLVVNRPDPATIVMEQATGALAHSSQVRYTTYRRIGPVSQSAVALPARVHDATLDVGAVQHLLPCSHDEWIRWIDPAIGIRSTGAHYVVAELDERSGSLRGLPRSYAESLDPLIRDHAGDRVVAVTPTNEPAPEVRPSRWSTIVTAADVVVGPEEHAARLETALGGARSRVLVASAFVSAAAVERIAPHVQAAAERGVDVDVLWGYAAGGPEASGLAALDELASKLRGGRLRFNRSPSGSHMKVLAWDDQAGWRSLIGSHNWLSAYGSTHLIDLSVEVRSREVLATIARHVASIWAASPGEMLSPAPSSWQAVAAEVSGQLDGVKDLPGPDLDADQQPVDVSLVYGRSHEIELRNALRTSRSRVLVASHRVSKEGLERLVAGSGVERAEGFRGYAIVGEAMEGITQPEVLSAARAVSLSVQWRPIHAKVLVSDGSVVVGSYNYLAADPAGRGSRSRELSIKVHDQAFADLMLRRLVESLSGVS